ncbi:outer membrane protein transport protein [Candidatus Igneacidithiobacillus taiwanensis]|uniref:OmpP1/FadL family transporter n=2 Tax=Candidatus Igneacidithiobacillus taiwanensis TaxID=1945924 RepID=UPI00289EFEDE|nr:outer membrane protein transport protein [Candidatus Igneacidithiobacillus taiwanensis]
MKKTKILGCAVAAAIAAAAFSGSAFATNGYQLIGIGQYAVGMGGAVVAAPDDPLSAAISNPAGLALMHPQAAFSAQVFNPTRKTNMGFGEIGSHSNVYGIPAIGWVAPAFGDGIVFGGGVYGTSGLGVNYLQNVPANPRGFPYGGYAQAYSSITFIQMAPSIAMKVNDHLAVGASLNIAAEQGSFQQTLTQFAPATVIQPGVGQVNTVVPVSSGLNLSTPSWAYGVGLTIGALYKVNDMVTLGATYKSPMIFTPLTFQAGTQSAQLPDGSPVQGASGQYSGRLNYPQQIALGIAIRPISRWLVSIEGQWINWHNTLNNFNIYGPWQGTGVVPLGLHWQNQWVANFGTQYDVNNWLQVRAGYTWGSNPVPNTSAAIAANTIFPAIVQNAITFGATQKLGMGWKLTEAYMHAFSNTMTGAPGSAPFALGDPQQAASSTLAENSYGLQVGYDF